MTLVEVMIALLITVVGLLGALSMLSAAFRGGAYTRNVSEAMALVQSKLEIEVSRTPISLTVPANGLTTEPLPLDGLGQTTGAGPFPYTRTTVWLPSTDGLRRKIRVTVTFDDSAGKTHPLMAERERNLP